MPALQRTEVLFYEKSAINWEVNGYYNVLKQRLVGCEASLWFFDRIVI